MCSLLFSGDGAWFYTNWISLSFCLVSTVVFLYMFYCITVFFMGLEPATKINWKLKLKVESRYAHLIVGLAQIDILANTLSSTPLAPKIFANILRSTRQPIALRSRSDVACLMLRQSWCFIMANACACVIPCGVPHKSTTSHTLHTRPCVECLTLWGTPRGGVPHKSMTSHAESAWFSWPCGECVTCHGLVSWTCSPQVHDKSRTPHKAMAT